MTTTGSNSIDSDYRDDTETVDGLTIDGVTVRFGGLTAVDGVSLHAPMGQITGLIGPNGAGKSTTFNACSGVVSPSSGTVRLDGKRIDRFSSARRAQLGLGRTFQRMELWETMTVRENVALGREAIHGGRRPWGQFLTSKAQRADVTQRTDDAIDRCAIGNLVDTPAGELSTGQGRLVELARALASGFRFLLLDEPSSGLDPVESHRFGRILQEVADSGVGVLLVEHDMTLVRMCCQRIFVLDFGQLIRGGDAEEVLASDEVRTAYLGSTAPAEPAEEATV